MKQAEISNVAWNIDNAVRSDLNGYRAIRILVPAVLIINAVNNHLIDENKNAALVKEAEELIARYEDPSSMSRLKGVIASLIPELETYAQLADFMHATGIETVMAVQQIRKYQHLFMVCSM